MVDCRLCKYVYKIWKEDCVDEIKYDYKVVCMAKETFIDWDYVSEGPCDLYVDMDGHIPRDGDM